MKLTDIVNQLRAVLPKYTGYFSTAVPVSSIVASGGIATISTAVPHSLSDGANVVMKDVKTKTLIDGVSQDGLIFTFTTSSDHDLTYGWPDHEYINLENFTDATWNGSFYLTSVTNRRTFKVRSSNTLPILNGLEVLPEIRSDGVNGRFAITVVDTTTFKVYGDFTDGAYEGGNVSVAQRIAGAVNEDRAIDQYTAQGVNDLWMFVVMAEATVSKDRNTLSDATATKSTGNDMRIRLVDGFSVFIVKNTTEDITANGAVDLCRHDLFLPILKSLNGIRFDTGLTYDGDFKTVMIGHGVYDYNGAVMTYRYDFEVTMDLTNSDTVEPEDTRAFRDIDYIHSIGGDDTAPVTTLPINLDEDPF